MGNIKSSQSNCNDKSTLQIPYLEDVSNHSSVVSSYDYKTGNNNLQVTKIEYNDVEKTVPNDTLANPEVLNKVWNNVENNKENWWEI